MRVQRKANLIDRLLDAGKAKPPIVAVPVGGGSGFDHGIVKSLPSSPAVGDRCTLEVTATGADATVLWNLIYTGEGERPWAYVGGAPLHRTDADLRSLTNQTTYANLPTDPMSIVLPAVKGDWDITCKAVIDCDESGQVGAYSYAVGATAAADTWGAFLGAGGNQGESLEVTHRHTAVASGATIAEKARTGGNYTIDFQLRHLWIRPVRLG